MLQPIKTRLLLNGTALILFAAYIAILTTLYQVIGEALIIFSLVPALIIAWQSGIKAGLLSALVVNSTTFVLLHIVYHETWIKVFDLKRTPEFVIVFIIACILVGYMRELSNRLAKELAANKQTEQDALEKKLFLDAIFSAAPVGLSLSKNRIQVKVNTQLTIITGYSAKELIGQSSRILYDSDAEFERIGKQLYTELSEHNQRSMTYGIIRRKDGSFVDVLFTAALFDSSDSSAGHVVSILDVSDQTRAMAALAESEKSFKDMFSMTSGGVALIDPATLKFVAVNPAMCAMLGYTETEFFSMTAEDITPLTSKEIMHEAVAKNALAIPVKDHEGTCRKKDGSIIQVIVGNHQLLWKRKAVHFTTFTDVTNLKNIQAQLEKKNNEILEFTNMVTHDLRKPLTTMNIVLGLAAKNAFGTLNTDGADAISTGLEASHYMQEMLEDLLLCARLDNGMQELSIEDISFVEITQQVTKRLKLQLDEKEITITVPETDVHVRADRKQFSHVLMNLAGNSINYIGKGAGKFIRIGWKNEGAEIVFFVEDNGIGIPEKSKADLFKKFKRGSNVSGISGTGLGLSIVNGIVLAHKGRLWVTSEEGKGTTFYFTFNT